MLTTNRNFSKLGLSFAAALLLSSAGGSVAHANPFPTSSDEARLLAGKLMTLHATAVAFPIIGAYRVRRNVRHRRRMQHGSIAGEPRTVARAFHLVVLRDPGELAARVDQ